MLVFKNSGVFRKVQTVPNIFWSQIAILRGGYFWVFEPMFHLFYLIKMHISFNNLILCRVPQVLRLKYGVLYWSSVVKTLKPWGTLPKIKLKAFFSIWFRPGSNRWPSACERETLCNDLKNNPHSSEAYAHREVRVQIPVAPVKNFYTHISFFFVFWPWAMVNGSSNYLLKVILI